MGEEDSKWREAVHAQTQVSRTNVQERVAQMELYKVQADFTASMRLTTRNYYELDGAAWEDSSGMFVFVYWGLSLMYVWILPVSFLTVSLLSHNLRVQFK